MKLVPGLLQGRKEALEIKFRTANGREGAADQGEFHSSFSLQGIMLEEKSFGKCEHLLERQHSLGINATL